MELKFSVCIPVYNAEKYIIECLESVIAQTYDDYEVIIVDDGSTDDSSRICDEYADKDSRFKIFHQENKGPYYSRSEAIKRASGEYLVFLDADDLLDKMCLEYLNNILDTSVKDADIICFSHYAMYANKNVVRCVSQSFSDTTENRIEKEYKNISQKEMSVLLMQSYRYNTVWGKALKSDMAKRSIMALSDKLLNGEDAIQIAKCIISSEKIVFCKKTLYYYRQRKNSIAHQFDKNTIYGAIRAHYIVDKLMSESVLLKEENSEVYSMHNVLALNNFLEQIYKNNISRVGFSEKKKNVSEIMQNENVRKLIDETDAQSLKIYNRCRLMILKKNLLSMLIIIDCMIRGIQNVSEVISGKKKYA